MSEEDGERREEVTVYTGTVSDPDEHVQHSDATEFPPDNGRHSQKIPLKSGDSLTFPFPCTVVLSIRRVSHCLIPIPRTEAYSPVFWESHGRFRKRSP
jgi:hypothetical protein